MIEEQYHTEATLRRAFREALALVSSPVLLFLAGSAAGLVTALFAPFLLLYGGCFLGPTGVDPTLPTGAVAPTCLQHVPTWRSFWQSAWPTALALVGAFHALGRRYSDRLLSKRLHVQLGPYIIHRASLVAGIAAFFLYSALAATWRIWPLVTWGVPMWLLSMVALPYWLSGIENCALRLFVRTDWASLTTAIVRAWLPRRFGPGKGSPHHICLTDSTLSVQVPMDAADALRAADLMLRSLPGIDTVTITDAQGMTHTEGSQPRRTLSPAQTSGHRELAAIRAAQRAAQASGTTPPTFSNDRGSMAQGLTGALPKQFPGQRVPALILFGGTVLAGFMLVCLVWWLVQNGIYRPLTSEDLKLFFLGGSH